MVQSTGIAGCARQPCLDSVDWDSWVGKATMYGSVDWDSLVGKATMYGSVDWDSWASKATMFGFSRLG